MQYCERCHAEFPPGTRACPGCGTRFPRRWGQTLLTVVCVSSVVAFLGNLLVGRAPRSRNHGMLTACKSNLKNIGTALEMYSEDARGLGGTPMPSTAAAPGLAPSPGTPTGGERFPGSLDGLTPSYLKVLPTCPSVSSETYRQGYAVAPDAGSYTVVCAGGHHRNAGLSENHPQYTSTQGLIGE